MTHITLRRMAQGMHASRAQLTTHFATHERIALDQIAAEIAQQCTLTRADVLGCIVALTEMVAKYTARGCSVSLGELGTFTASLTSTTTPTHSHTEVEAHREATTDIPKETNEAVRVVDVHVRRINFRAGRTLLQLANERLQQSVVKPKCVLPQLRPQTTRTERLALVQRYLHRYGVISVRQYMQLANISHRRAAEELRYWRERPETHIGTAGCGTHRMAVWIGTR
ncbi:MAG: hypothetical protein Q4A44_01960 [Bacteroidales bacterium]|nr:hypothetical protein [Bacteroidales bacterium]